MEEGFESRSSVLKVEDFQILGKFLAFFAAGQILLVKEHWVPVYFMGLKLFCF